MWKRLGLGAVMVFTSLTMAPGAAEAATVGGCAQGWTEWPGTCISVVTGDKNSTNHTQYVKSIKVTAPREARVNNKPSKLEAWAGNGPTGVAWYRSTTGLEVTWTIDKWIKDRSGICGSYTWPNSTNRSIACITIRA